MRRAVTPIIKTADQLPVQHHRNARGDVVDEQRDSGAHKVLLGQLWKLGMKACTDEPPIRVAAKTNSSLYHYVPRRHYTPDNNDVSCSSSGVSQTSCSCPKSGTRRLRYSLGNSFHRESCSSLLSSAPVPSQDVCEHTENLEGGVTQFFPIRIRYHPTCPSHLKQSDA
eukprot:717993-Hanusia_phi.AAC.11